MIEINLIALKEGARRRKQVVATGIPAAANYGPCVRAGELVFPSGQPQSGGTAVCPAPTRRAHSMH
jgi:hypothetical protein